VSDQQSGYPGAPPGWYGDPAGGPAQRWWDGYAWTEALAQPSQPVHPAPASTPPWAAASAHYAASNTAALVSRELSITPAARLALAYPGVSSLLLLLFARVNASQLRNVGHQFHLSMLASQHNLPAPAITVPPLNGPVGAIVSFNWLISIVAIVLSLVWQHRAASAARSLGLPARHSPGWGVGSWFVPIVNWWFPYQALVDCLDAGNPARPLVLRYWVCGVGTGLLTGAALFSSFFSPGVSLGLSIPAALLGLGVISQAPAVVTSIAGFHRTQTSGTTTQPG
jgi:hypothetical protein